MPGNRIGFHQRGFDFWTKTAVDIEQNRSKHDNEHDRFFTEFISSLVDLSNSWQHDELRIETDQLKQQMSLSKGINNRVIYLYFQSTHQ
jgi:hypothetical protein